MVLKASLVNTPGSLAVLGLSFSVRFGRSRFARYISLLVVGFAFLSSDLTVRAQMATNDISIATNDTSTLGQFKSFLQSRPAIVRVTFDRQVLTSPPRESHCLRRLPTTSSTTWSSDRTRKLANNNINQ